MTSDPIGMTSEQPGGVRAGFWRRALSSLIDGIIISLPFQLIVAFLFVSTVGRIQLYYGVNICSVLNTLPDGLAPPPPAGSNFATECNVYAFFGAQTARSLQVGRVTTEGTITKTAARNYMLDRDGHPIDGVSVDWIVMLSLIAYVIAMETRTGATLGSRAMRIRVIDAAAPAGPSVPLRKIVLRYLAASIGSLPILAVLLIYYLALYGSDVDKIAASSFLVWLFITFMVLLGWLIFLSVQIATKRDPLYDRMAGTAVVRLLRDRHQGDHAR
jgi:uncharacterized RDD family membrane protein YckC